MKKKCLILLSLLLIVMGNMVVFAADGVEHREETFMESEAYQDIKKEEAYVKESIAALLYEDNSDAIPQDFNPVLQYDRAEKVYIDTGIENQKTVKEEEIRDFLNKCNYVWVIPAEVDGKNIQVTVGKGQPLNPERSKELTEEEREKIAKNEGKWEITEVAVREMEPYARQMEKMSDIADEYVLVGGIPGLRMPIAIGFKDQAAKYWIELGYQYEILEEMPKTKTAQDGIFDYGEVKSRLEEYESNPNVLGGGQSDEVGENNKIVWIGGITACVIIGIVLIYFMRRRANSR